MLRYNFILYLLSPFIILKLLYYTIKNNSGISYLLKRLLGSNIKNNKSIWIHASSVGETKIALEVLKKLYELGHKDILITTSTPSSKQIIDTVSMCEIDHLYIPFDFYFTMKRFVRNISPKLLIIIETEIWPNLYNQCKKGGSKIIIINARLNPNRSLLQNIIKDIYTKTLQSVDGIYCKSKKDYEVFSEYVNKEKIKNLGNIKYSLLNENNNPHRIIDRKYVLLASSHHREEIIIIKEWLKLKSNKYLLVVAPRHPERLGDILSDIPLSGINIAIRSKNETIRNSTQVYIADTIGEMTSLIKYSEFTIFGGSFVDVGGHDFIEGALHGKAIIVGPYMYNFIEETEEFLTKNAIIMCKKPEMLKNIFDKLFRSKNKKEIFENNAKQLAMSKTKIIDTYLEIIIKHI